MRACAWDVLNATLKIAWTVKVSEINPDLRNTCIAALDRRQPNGAVVMVRWKELYEDEEMTVVSLVPWLPASPRHKPHPAIAGIEHLLPRAFPLPDAEPEGRLLAALTRLADAERLSDLAPSQSWWKRLAS